jgi:hypothetical protein
MLNSFIEWARRLEAEISATGIHARVTESVSSDNSSARLDIDTPATVARITCWESGDYDAEVIDVETECSLYSAHGTLQGSRTIAEQFAAFFNTIGITVKIIESS